MLTLSPINSTRSSPIYIVYLELLWGSKRWSEVVFHMGWWLLLPFHLQGVRDHGWVLGGHISCCEFWHWKFHCYAQIDVESIPRYGWWVLLRNKHLIEGKSSTSQPIYVAQFYKFLFAVKTTTYIVSPNILFVRIKTPIKHTYNIIKNNFIYRHHLSYGNPSYPRLIIYRCISPWI